MEAWWNEDKRQQFLFISKDDKAYLCPGTSVGATGLRKKTMYISTDPEKQLTLPQRDWADSKAVSMKESHPVTLTGETDATSKAAKDGTMMFV